MDEVFGLLLFVILRNVMCKKVNTGHTHSPYIEMDYLHPSKTQYMTRLSSSLTSRTLDHSVNVSLEIQLQ